MLGAARITQDRKWREFGFLVRRFRVPTHEAGKGSWVRTLHESIKAASVRKATGNQPIRSTSLEKTRGPFHGLRYRVCHASFTTSKEIWSVGISFQSNHMRSLEKHSDCVKYSPCIHDTCLLLWQYLQQPAKKAIDRSVARDSRHLHDTKLPE